MIACVAIAMNEDLLAILSTSNRVCQTVTIVAEQSLRRAAVAQTVSWDDQIAVTIPADLLTRTVKVSLGTLPSISAPRIKSIRALQGYAMRLDSQIQPTMPITIEIAFRPEQIDTDLPLEEALALAVWDDKASDWVPVPSVVDTNRMVVQAQIYSRGPTAPVSTLSRALPLARPAPAAWESEMITANAALVAKPAFRESFWTVTYIARGYRLASSPHFTVIYDPQQLIVIEHSQVAAADVSHQASEWLETFYHRYQRQNLPVHTWGKQFVFIGQEADYPDSPPSHSSYGFSDPFYVKPVNYNISLPAQLISEQAAQMELAHKLFHQVEHQWAWALEMTFVRTWWMEAAADYAADRIALKAGGALMGATFTPDHLHKPLASSIDEQHNRARAHLIDYLAQQGMDFSDAFYAVTRTGSAHLLLDSYLSRATKRDLAGYYRDFIAYVLFDRAGPQPVRAMAPYTALPDSQQDTLEPCPDVSKEYRTWFSNGYSVRVWGLRVADDPAQPNRAFQVEVLHDIPQTQTLIYVLPGDQRMSGGAAPVMSLQRRGATAQIAASAGDVIYLVVVSADDETRLDPIIQVRITGLCAERARP